MNKYIRNNISAIGIILIIVTVLILIFVEVVESIDIKHKAKIEALTKADNKIINELVKITNTKSDIELLEEMASYSHKESVIRLGYINEAKEQIIDDQKIYELSLLKKVCAETQIERKINGLEYNIEYCNSQENLEQFRVKKY